MKIKDIENICWICGRSREELDKPFEDDNFSIPLLEVEDQISYSGYYVCGICEDIIMTLGCSEKFIDEYLAEQFAEKMEDFKKELIQIIGNI